MGFVSIAAFLANSVLPGSWLAFSPLFARFDGWTRLLFALILSIPVACLEYEVLRATGLASEPAVAGLGLANLPALALIWRSRAGFPWPGAMRAMALAASLAVPLAFLVAVFAWFPEKVFWGHTWLHADMIYALRENSFAPEERQLAGFSATYPWFGHLWFLIQSSALGLSPLLAFPWVNLVLALAFGGFAMALIRALGGGFAAVLLAPPVFAFAVNPVGVAIGQTMTALGRATARWAYLLGDPRYDFMLIKHMRLNFNQIGITLLAGLILLAIEPPRQGRVQEAGIVLMVLVITLLYPLYMPVAMTVVAARIAALTAFPQHRDLPRLAALSVAAGGAAGFAAALVILPLGSRSTGTGITIAGPGLVWRHAVMAVTALSLPSIAALWLMRERVRAQPVAATTLALSGLGCAALAVFAHIPNKENEYKFVFAAGLALLPFLAIAVARLLDPPRRPANLVALATFLVLCVGATLDSVARRTLESGRAPALLAFDSLYQSLDPADPLAAAVAWIRRESPPDSLLLAEDTQLELSVLTQRAQYVPFDPERQHPGMTFANDYLLANVKGFDPRVIAARRNELLTLFDGSDGMARQEALTRIRTLNRPVLILVTTGQRTALENWLERTGTGHLAHADPAYEVWLIP